MVLLLAEQSDTKSNVKLGGFRSQLQASYESNHTEKLWYNKTVCLWMTLHTHTHTYIYIINKVKLVSNRSWKWPEGFLFSMYHTKV